MLFSKFCKSTFSQRTHVRCAISYDNRNKKKQTMVRLLLMITGASRGLGRCITKAFHEQDNDKKIESISCHLIARSAENLEQTRREILEAIEKRRKSSSSCCSSDDDDDDNNAGCAVLQTQISIHPIDLGDLSHLEESMGTVFEEMSAAISSADDDFDRVILINNHGTLGHLGPAAATSSSSTLEDMQRAVNLNITSCLWMSVMFSRFVQDHLQRGSMKANSSSATIVNISSLAAVQPFPTMSIYAAGKAVREKKTSFLHKSTLWLSSTYPNKLTLHVIWIV
jgi:short-subunit dehydrogenase